MPQWMQSTCVQGMLLLPDCVMPCKRSVKLLILSPDRERIMGDLYKSVLPI